MKKVKVACVGGPHINPCPSGASVRVFGTAADGGDELLCWRHLTPVIRAMGPGTYARMRVL